MTDRRKDSMGVLLLAVVCCVLAGSLEVVDHLEKQLFHLDNFIWHKMIND